MPQMLKITKIEYLEYKYHGDEWTELLWFYELKWQQKQRQLLIYLLTEWVTLYKKNSEAENNRSRQYDAREENARYKGIQSK